MTPINDILAVDKRRTDFLSTRCPQSRVGELNRFPLIARNADFLLEEEMYNKEVSRRYREKHGKEIYQRTKEYFKEYHIKNREKRNKASRERYAKNKVKYYEAQRTWAINNPGKVKATRIRWNKKHPGKATEFSREWSKRNPYKVKARHIERRTKSPMSHIVIQRVYEDNIKKHGTLTCYICLKPINFGNDSIEHNIPTKRGGTNDYDNLGVSHILCNSSKRQMTLEEFKEKQKTGG